MHAVHEFMQMRQYRGLHLRLTTRCYQVDISPAKFNVPIWHGGFINVADLEISCEVPSTANGASNVYFVDDAVGLVNALVAAQNFSNFAQARIVIRQNISFADLYSPSQPRMPQLPISINMDISAADSTIQTIINWNLVLWVFAIYSPTASLSFSNLLMMNISPVRGLVVPHMGYLPLFSVPFWAVWWVSLVIKKLMKLVLIPLLM